jgi:hypothetical protein
MAAIAPGGGGEAAAAEWFTATLTPALAASRVRTLRLAHNGWLLQPASPAAEAALHALGGLRGIDTLDLSHNALRELPSALLQLRQLTFLDLTGNDLRQLPPALHQLGKLRELQLHGNPLHTPPPDVVAAGTAAVLAFCRDMAAGGIAPWPTLKLLLLGEQKAGKTSLLNGMRRGRVDLAKEEQRTVGIDVWSWRPYGAFRAGDVVSVAQLAGEDKLVGEVKVVNGDDTYEVAIGLEVSHFEHRPRRTVAHSLLAMHGDADAARCCQHPQHEDGACPCRDLLVRAYDAGGHDEYKSTVRVRRRLSFIP